MAGYSVSSAEDVLSLLAQGGRNRAVRGTEYNEASSRSHALLQLSVEVETVQEGGSTIIRRAKLNLVRGVSAVGSTFAAYQLKPRNPRAGGSRGQRKVEHQL